MIKVKRIGDENSEEIIFKGQEGWVEFEGPDGSEGNFTFNLAPDEQEDQLDMDKDAALEYLQQQIKHLQMVKRFIQAIPKPEVSLDFYWREGDLNMRIQTKIQIQ